MLGNPSCFGWHFNKSTKLNHQIDTWKMILLLCWNHWPLNSFVAALCKKKKKNILGKHREWNWQEQERQTSETQRETHNSSEMSQCWVTYLNLAGRGEQCAEVGWGKKNPWLSLNTDWLWLSGFIVQGETNSILLLQLGLMNWQTLLEEHDGAPARGDCR